MGKMYGARPLAAALVVAGAALVVTPAGAAETRTLTWDGMQLAQAKGAVAPRPVADPVVRRAQEALAAARFNPGPIDGVMGNRTRQAIRDFQIARRIAPSGNLDAATLAALGVR